MTVLALGTAATMVLARAGADRRQLRAARSPHLGAAPVRRASMEAGTFEDLFFSAPGKGETDRMLRAARAALDTGRRLKRLVRTEHRILTATERTLTALTAGAVRVFEEICTLARLNAGRVFPSYDWLADATSLGRATVARAIRLLEAAGLLVRQRRFKRLKGEGPRYAQTSNVYRPILPQQILNLLPRWLRPAPVPVDVTQHEAERAQETASMQTGLTTRDLAGTLVDGALGQMLARLGEAVDRAERESQTGSATRPKLFIDAVGTS